MSGLVTIYGGSGFVGRYIARRLAKQGWRIRVAVRRPNEALFVKPYGAVGQVEPVLCNIRDDASVRAAMAGVDAVVNCVGILNRSGKNTFDAVHAEGAARIARIAAEQGVARLVHVSALGADPASSSAYARTKAEGEAAVKVAFPGAVILRPSVIFGNEDGFFNRFASMSRFTPVLFIAGGKTRFQPVYVDDVALAAVKAVNGEAAPGIYELGGAETDTLKGFIGQMLKVVNRRRVVINLPFWIAAIPAAILDFVQAATAGLVSNAILTRDQLRSLRTDNTVAADAMTLETLGIAPTPVEVVLPEYLWRYRPDGQYTAIRDSARNLRKV